MRATEHLPRGPSRVLECIHGLSEVAERDGGVLIVDAPDERGPAQKRKAKRPRETVELTGMHVGKSVEGAQQKKNGKWRCPLFPGREFDDLDELRAAKKQRKERRAAYTDQLGAYGGRR